MRGLINIQNVDNEFFRWCLVGYLNPVTKNVAKIRNVDRTFAKQFNFKGGLKFLFHKKDYTKLKNKIIFSLIVWLWKQNTIPYLCFKAGFFEKQFVTVVKYYYLFLLLSTIIVCYYCKICIMLIKDFNKFMTTKQGIMVRNIFVDSAYNASLAQDC